MTLGEKSNYEQQKLNNTEKIVDSAEHTDKKNVVEIFNNNQKLAKEEADKIVEGLPGTLNQLSPEQQKQFVGFIEEYMKGTNLNFAPKDIENVPDVLPSYRKQQIDIYTNTRKNISMLPIDQQEILKKAEKEAISQMTEDSNGALESGGVTMLGESEPDSAPNTEYDSTTPNQGDEGNSESQGGGAEF